MPPFKNLNKMTELNPFNYLHKQVEGLIYEHHFMPNFLEYSMLQKLVKEEFERMKTYQEIITLEFAEKIVNHWAVTEIPKSEIQKFYNNNFNK